MEINAVKTFTNNLGPIDEVAWHVFEQYFTTQKLSKGEDLWSSGEVCKHIVFLCKGLIRVHYFSPEQDKEITIQFLFQDGFFSDYFSLVRQLPSQFSYTAVENCELITIPRIALYEMYDRFKYFERFGRLIIEQSYLNQQRVLFDLKNSSANAKYLNLIKDIPDVFKRIPSKMIASYLGITPEHLSRLKKKQLDNSDY